ncbi:MAG: sigma-54-dependent Fis family transcriptional regulator [Deltaproteobacteria bacterium]|nr:sigma-54-dependent Fis family transcriptional regulator [Deltaproteobacteria bacterium]NCP02834.1 sigma-54-dependent Fis family transcriptional regulator [Deltaproteobacteria bacterium]NCP77923.1 sigma-54-dependent Fis family transcriptional regulator [Desulfuromonadales bacterium]
MKKQVLVIDDDASLRRVIEFTLDQAGYEVFIAASGEEGLDLYRRHRPALVMTDVQMSGISGYAVLEQIRQLDPDALVILITAFSSVENAVEAIRKGAYNYITKPFSRDQLTLAVDKAFEYRGLRRENVQLKNVLQADHGVEIIGNSPEMKRLMQRVDKVAASQVSVLLTGESGTGKEVVAQTLHRRSERAGRPFVAVNCAAIPRDLIESELFGHIKGSFTGAVKDRQGKFSLANGGTLFLDEIGEMPLELQPKLLRALQEQEIEPVGGTPESVDVRVIAATNRELELEMEQGRFRDDLYYRLAVVPLRIPALREREGDIPLLLKFFLQKHAGSKVQVDPEVIEKLTHYAWPGNVREMENVVEQMLILRADDRLGIDDLPPRISRRSAPGHGVLNLPDEGYSLEDLEREAVVYALNKSNWNKSKAADFLRIPRHTLLYRLEKYAIRQD